MQRPETYDLSDRQLTDASDRAVDSRVVSDPYESGSHERSPSALLAPSLESGSPSVFPTGVGYWAIRSKSPVSGSVHRLSAELDMYFRF
jgi:hypothetical protein